MEESKKNREETLKHIDRQVARMEDVIARLLRNLNIDELSTSERIDLALRCSNYQNRTLELRINCTSSENSDPAAMVALTAALTAEMRGLPDPDKVKEEG